MPVFRLRGRLHPFEVFLLELDKLLFLFDELLGRRLLFVLPPFGTVGKLFYFGRKGLYSLRRIVGRLTFARDGILMSTMTSPVFIAIIAALLS